ncbi:MAG: hypothetical protein H0V01_02980 [Bacteroidetes bacterium]|nr:hypothetical protein [Bacteroidota bacterium]HET6245896.1 hypothetical protein [Bacteroidia bacterium]
MITRKESRNNCGIEKPEEYRYSSAKDYAGEKGLLEMEIVMRKWKTYK